jgi:ADP-heptose:LPS heptosyltransferase
VVVFTVSPEDREIVDDIIYNTNYSAINACGDFSLGGLAALLSKAALMISADTGPLHLARAVNTSTVGFYWAPNLINWGPLTRSIHRPLISWKMECPICGTVPNDPYPFEPKTDVCDHPVSFVSGISIEQVLTAVEQLLPPEAIANDTNSVRDVAMKSINN